MDLIWDLLDRYTPFSDIITEWSEINAVAQQAQLFPPHDPFAGSMLFFAYFLTKDPRPYSIAHRVDRAAKYMNVGNLPKFHSTWCA